MQNASFKRYARRYILSRGINMQNFEPFYYVGKKVLICTRGANGLVKKLFSQTWKRRSISNSLQYWIVNYYVEKNPVERASKVRPKIEIWNFFRPRNFRHDLRLKFDAVHGQAFQAPQIWSTKIPTKGVPFGFEFPCLYLTKVRPIHPNIQHYIVYTPR